MSKRTSGLGRGLGDLLADNAPEIGSGATVVWRDEGGEVVVTPDSSDAVKLSADTAAAEVQEKPVRTVQSREEEPTVGEQLSAPLVFPAYGESADGAAKNVEKSGETEQKAGAEVANDVPTHSEHHPHRSLKALFKSYK